MKWNWQQKDWSKFTFDQDELQRLEADFLYSSGVVFGVFKYLSKQDQEILKIELISDEALKTSEIEGEILNRDSLQSSICRNFGLKTDHRKIPAAEKGISDMMMDLYHNFAEELTHETLFKWHEMLTNGRRDLQDIGRYRTCNDPMQIVSGNIFEPKVHFEAPPAKLMQKEMECFIQWFNDSAINGKNSLSPLIRAGIVHLYFVSIHPFEDGNGRIARGLAIKALSQSINWPLLTSLSTIIQNNKKKYYDALESSSKDNEITRWLIYFARTFIESQNYTQKLIEFLVEKAKLYQTVKDQLNERQEKVLTRMFSEGLDGFKGGLSAENYIAITKISRPTATRDLHDLVEKKVLIKKGELKGTRYFLNIKVICNAENSE